ncbi:MAG: flagellar filament capping protein FliD, partial [Acetivibrio sp.]
MGIKLSGMISGMDTDAIIKELMSAQSMKKTKLEKNQTKLTWKQEKWKELNTKIYALYTGTLTKMKTQGNYQSKKVSISDETKAAISVSNTAPKGAHTLQVEQLASAQYLTSGVITTDASGSKAVGATTLSSLGITENTVITIKGSNPKKDQKLIVDSKTTLNDFVSSCQNAGVNATYDSAQGRLFISSKETGENQKFTITTSSVTEAYVKAGKKLNELTGYNSLKSEDKAKVDEAYTIIKKNAPDSQEYKNAAATLTSYAEKYAKAQFNESVDGAIQGLRAAETTKAYEAKADEVLTDYVDQATWLTSEEGKNWVTKNPGADEAATKKAYEAAHKAKKEETITLIKNDAAYKSFREGVKTTVETKYSKTSTGAAWTEIKDKAKVTADTEADAAKEAVTSLNTTITDYKNNCAELPAGSSGGNSLLTKIGMGEITGDEVLISGSGNVSGLTVTKAKNSRIVLDGATLESASNNISANYMTFDLKGMTKANESISFTVLSNVDQTYDMVKGFVKEYNTLLEEMNKLYDTKPAKGYEPLTQEEKDAMSDDEVEKWENKIKESILRRDPILDSVTSAMRSALMGQVEVDGKTYSLASFGIRTSSDYTEKGKIHIYGDADDGLYAAEKNLLKGTLEGSSDAIERGLTPEALVKTLSKISQNLYDTMTEKMERSSISSALTFYNDKEMTAKNNAYTKQIKEWEDRLSAMESRYYKQ